MTVKIGRKSYTTRKPQDLDQALIAATGCNADEIGRMLTGEPLAGTVAHALIPFLAEADKPHHAALAAEIEAAGRLEVGLLVAKLYGEEMPATPPPPAPSPPTPGAGGETK